MSKINWNDNLAVILKGAFAKLGDNHILCLTQLYHSHKGDSTRSWYRFEATVQTRAALQEYINQKAAEAVTAWHYPTLPTYTVDYDHTQTTAREARWIKKRLDKALSLTEFLAKAQVKDTHGIQVYELKNFKEIDMATYQPKEQGLTISLDEMTEEQLIELEGKFFSFVCPNKKAIKKALKAQENPAVPVDAVSDDALQAVAVEA